MTFAREVAGWTDWDCASDAGGAFASAASDAPPVVLRGVLDDAAGS